MKRKRATTLPVLRPDQPRDLSPWLQFLLAAKAPVAGVFPLPMELALTERLGLQDANVLLVSRHNAGVRQTFLKERRFASAVSLRCGRDHPPRTTCRADPQHARIWTRSVTHVEDVVSV